MTQQALAATLDVSQATASKLLRGTQTPRPGLLMRIEDFLAERHVDGAIDDIDAVVVAYKASEDFRCLCRAALRLMNNDE